MKLIIVMTILASTVALCQDDAMLELDPFSAKYIEAYYPQAIQVRMIPSRDGQAAFKGSPGPKIQEIRTVNYAQLVPHLIRVVQKQQREIQEIKNVGSEKEDR